jgi:hypothetical protein
VKIEIPVSHIANHDNVTRIQFFISESNYRHEDVLDFYIDDICLLRYAEPHVSDLKLFPGIGYADMPALRVAFRALGIPADEQRPARIQLRSGADVLLTAEGRASRGANEMVLPLGDRIAGGRYDVEITVGQADPVVARLRLVDSPWAQ